MKMKVNMLLLALVTLLLSGCTSAFYSSSSVSDDLYALHNRTEIARRQQAEAEARKAEAEARKAEWEAMIAEAAATSTQKSYLSGSRTESYQSVLADDYQSAYARRLRGMESPTYRMPSSYMDARYSSTFHYVSAYDPAFYNVMVMGDQVWVEPKYVTAMFGTWGMPSYSSAWYWNRWTTPWWMPSYSIGIGGWGWNIGFSWYDPWFYDWYNPWYGPYYGWYRPYYNPYYYPYHGPHHGPHHGPYWNGGGGYRPGRPGVVHRAPEQHYTKPYGGQGSNINRTQQGDRNWNSGVYQGGSRPQNGRPQGSGTVSRTPESSQKPSYNNSGSSPRRSGSSGSNSSSSQRPDNSRSNSNWSNNSSSNSNWGSSSSSRGGGYSGGGFSGGSRGGSSGSSSRGR